jgi:hypothetical protein
MADEEPEEFGPPTSATAISVAALCMSVLAVAIAFAALMVVIAK